MAVVHSRAIGSSESRRLETGVRLSVRGMPSSVSCSRMLSASASALRFFTKGRGEGGAWREGGREGGVNTAPVHGTCVSYII